MALSSLYIFTGICKLFINVLHLSQKPTIFGLVTYKEVMRLSNENGNGHGEYEPKVSYRYLDVDVWVKKNEVTGEETVTYTEDLLFDLFGENDSDNSNLDNNDN